MAGLFPAVHATVGGAIRPRSWAPAEPGPEPAPDSRGASTRVLLPAGASGADLAHRAGLPGSAAADLAPGGPTGVLGS